MVFNEIICELSFVQGFFASSHSSERKKEDIPFSYKEKTKKEWEVVLRKKQREKRARLKVSSVLPETVPWII